MKTNYLKYLLIFGIMVYGLAVGFALTHKAESTTKISSGMIQAFKATSSTYARTLEDRAADVINVKDFGAKGDGIANDGPAIQAAFDAGAGGRVTIPAGTYISATAPLVIKNGTDVRGSGRAAAAGGTRIICTHAFDCVQINNQVNASTAANITLAHLEVHSNVKTAGKAAVADIGSALIKFYDVAFSGNDFGLILDQTEIATVEKCDFEAYPVTSTAQLWLANYDDHYAHTPRAPTSWGGTMTSTAASGYYTNQITIRDNQFNSSSMTSAWNGIAIADDGGTAHIIDSNDLQGSSVQIRVAGGRAVRIVGNEMEGAAAAVSSTAAPIYFANTRISGSGVGTPPTLTAAVADNFILPAGAQYGLKFDTSSLYYLTLQTNEFAIFAPPKLSGAPIGPVSSRVTSITAESNYTFDPNQGSVSFATWAGYGFPSSEYVAANNIHATCGIDAPTWTPTWTASVNPSLNNGTLSAECYRTGNLVNASLKLTMGSSSTYGSGGWIFSLPYGVSASAPTLGSAYAYKSASSTWYTGTVVGVAGTYSALVYFGHPTTTLPAREIEPFTWGAGDVLSFTITQPTGQNTYP
jgi:hypothetical protein